MATLWPTNVPSSAPLSAWSALSSTAMHAPLALGGNARERIARSLTAEVVYQASIRSASDVPHLELSTQCERRTRLLEAFNQDVYVRGASPAPLSDSPDDHPEVSNCATQGTTKAQVPWSRP